ncbi:MAG: hypothetical protein ACRD2L_17150, partial [Terriglobia bacterium]
SGPSTTRIDSNRLLRKIGRQLIGQPPDGVEILGKDNATVLEPASACEAVQYNLVFWISLLIGLERVHKVL